MTLIGEIRAKTLRPVRYLVIARGVFMESLPRGRRLPVQPLTSSEKHVSQPRRLPPNPMSTMLHSRFKRPLALAALAACVLFAGQAQAQTADQVAQRLQQRYRALNAIQAEFVQNVGGASLRGTLTVRGDAFRIEMPDQMLVSNGATLWSYSQGDNQVVVQDYDEQELGFSIGQLFTNYLSVFRVTGATQATIGGVHHDVLALVPREAGTSVRDATLYVRSSDAVPTKVRVHDVNGSTLAFDLSNVRLNPRLSSDTFTFRFPRGVEVIDLRS